MSPEELKELVDRYPNNYELGEKVREIHYRIQNEKNDDTGMVWVGFLFLIVLSALLTWIVVA